MSSTSYSNPEFVEQATEELREEEREETVSRAAAREAKRRLEEKRESETETVTVDVQGEEIEMYPLQGLGETTSLTREFVEAERKGNEMDILIALDKMVERLHEKTVHDDIFDREFWNAFDDETITDAYEELGLKSRGGEHAGN